MILDMQLRTHYGFLSYLSQQFRLQDPDNFGYLPVQQFFEMTLDLMADKGNEDDVEEMLAGREGFSAETLTFSDVVLMYSARKIESQGDSITMLQYVFELGQLVDQQEEEGQGEQEEEEANNGSQEAIQEEDEFQ